MDRAGVERALQAAELALAEGGEVDLRTLGFWKAVNAVKKDSELVEEFTDRIGTIDQQAFERWALLKVPTGIGTTVMVLATLVGFLLVGWSYRLSSISQSLALLAGTAVLLVATHGITHQIIGSAQGMRFTCWFIGSLAQPQPGVKIDYASYLRVPARKRAWMHASGPLVTKVVPFLSLGAGWAMGAAGWVMAILGVAAIGQIFTDILWSTKKSDWKRFRREMSIAGS